MKIGIQTWGSQGDIFPFICLAKGLSDAGHDVTLAYVSIENKCYASEHYDFKLINVYDSFPEPESLIPNAIAKSSVLRQLEYLIEHAFDPAHDAIYDMSRQLCRESDIVIGHLMMHTLVTASELYACPRVSVVFAASAVYSQYTSPFGANVSFGKILNRLAWRLSDFIGARMLLKSAVKSRQAAGLSPIESVSKNVIISDELTLIASSPYLTTSQSDWGSHIQVCGFWSEKMAAKDWCFSDELIHFMKSGDKPVFYTFGSMGDLTPVETLKLLEATAALSGRRAIIQTCLHKQCQSTDQVHYVGHIAHHRIFPQCALIVHHGGAGTTQAALLSGRPSVVVEFGFDQKHWGKTLQRAKVTRNVLNIRTVVPEQVAKEINALAGNASYLLNAQQCAEAIRQEDGVARAVELIEQRFAALA